MGTAVSSLEDEHSTRANELPDSYTAKKEMTWVSWWSKAENAEIEIQIHTCLDYTDPWVSISSPPTRSTPDEAAFKKTFASSHEQLRHDYYRNTTAQGLQRDAQFVSNLNLSPVPGTLTWVLNVKLYTLSMLPCTSVSQFPPSHRFCVIRTLALEDQILLRTQRVSRGTQES